MANGRYIERLVSSQGRLNLIKAYVSDDQTVIAPAVRESKPQSWMRDEEIHAALYEYEEFGYDDLPGWLKQELQVRGLPHEPRNPTEQEQRETETDAFIHRTLNNEMTLDDYLIILTTGKAYHNV